ncbi:Adho30-like protein [Cryptophlebia peltastica nucleopolyhedrovirus]|uniref:Adho30-like protein n=1 Tax=Cryptophlebia peltastica nucleopolyhedrovirus TaxID=2304025 RepID=A0A346RNM8_9ABAC|nr:Adho30-like protein [Cryptophlebia peltastica nucleopolyhedrovirus]AXS67675.1 Adho30-like protein [Cryptophlebia peltastica nucleopolyhedrovirus]RTL85958.1 hypothetical protein EJV44_24790 [Ancylobacter aquaticus]
MPVTKCKQIPAYQFIQKLNSLLRNISSVEKRIDHWKRIKRITKDKRELIEIDCMLAKMDAELRSLRNDVLVLNSK